MSSLTIIHTTPVTIEPLKSLALALPPVDTVFNILDDSILPELAENGGDIGAIESRFINYVQIAQHNGADCILCACSSIGELVERAQAQVEVPVVRIDEAMAEAAVSKARRIGVAATLPTTLRPTTRLIQAKAESLGQSEVEVTPLLATEAYQRLMQGDKDGHDAILADALSKLAESVDLVVLAQASMARAVQSLSEKERHRFLTSPELGIERVGQVMSAKA